MRARYWNAGHILGSASIEVEVLDGDGKPVRILFSGDIGPDEKVFYNSPDAPSGFDYILSESTYGGRERVDYTLAERREALKTEINEALRRGGNLVIPAFAVERSQELLHDIGAADQARRDLTLGGVPRLARSRARSRPSTRNTHRCSTTSN